MNYANIAIHRNTVLWLLISQLLVLAPFLNTHPTWIMGLLLGCLGWRWWALQRGQLTLSPFIKYFVAILGLVTLYSSGYRHYNIDTMIAVVLLGFVLKSVETWQQRDVQMLVFTGFFVCSVHFIYSQTPWQAAYTLLALSTLIACLVSSHRRATHSVVALRHGLKTAGFILLMSAPLALLLFFVIPRISPLWAIPQQTRATTGLSDRITPGDIASLVKSADDAFRVTFFGDQPDKEQWYWRTLILRQFDGRTWTRGTTSPSESASNSVQVKFDYRYQIMMEASGQRWLPALDAPVAVEQDNVQRQQDRTLLVQAPINAVTGFTVLSDTQASTYRLDLRERQQALQLPVSGNQRLRQWAQQQRIRVSNDSAFISAVLAYIRNNDFSYTLRPPLLLSASSQDAFWFDSRQGFCSHYASAFTFVMRSVGIPARMVGGYLGGRYNVEDNFITVRQMDAHVWTEVWLPQRGWQRVDPTASIAPDRVNQDLDQILDNESGFVSDLAGRTPRLLALQKWQQWRDQFEYKWQRWVVQFDEKRRMGLLNRWLDDSDFSSQLIWLLSSFAILFVFWFLALLSWTSKSKKRKALQLLQKLEKKLYTHQLTRKKGETISVFLERVKQTLPDKHALLDAFVEHYHALEYQSTDPVRREAHLDALRTLLKQQF